VPTYSNENFNAETQRTKLLLTEYYKAPNYFNAEGYFSQEYGLVYYDGYGYNFYNGEYGYYEYSRAPAISTGSVFEFQRFVITLLCMVLFLLLFVFIYYKLETRKPAVQAKEK